MANIEQKEDEQLRAHPYEKMVLSMLLIACVVSITIQVTAHSVSKSEIEWLSRFFFVALLFMCYILASSVRDNHLKNLPGLRLHNMFIVCGVVMATYKALAVANLFFGTAVIGVVCYAWGYILYHRGIMRGTIKKPALGYWATITVINVLSLIVGIQQYSAGGDLTSLVSVCCWTLGSTSVLVVTLSKARDDRELRFSSSDTVSAWFAGIAAAVWLLSGSSNLAVICLAAAIIAACYPLMLSAIQGNESVMSLAPFALAASMGVFAVSNWSIWQAWLIPVVGCGTFCIALLGAWVYDAKNPGNIS